MLRLKSILFLFLLLFFSVLHGCSNSGNGESKTVFRQIPELEQIKPERNVKIKLKRSVNGDYTWVLKGDNLEKVVQVDRQLRESLREKSDAD
jgi:hypothetical protein